MDWDQIESKWAAMTRRVRGDLTITQVDAIGTKSRLKVRIDSNDTKGTDRQAGTAADQQNTLSTQ